MQNKSTTRPVTWGVAVLAIVALLVAWAGTATVCAAAATPPPAGSAVASSAPAPVSADSAVASSAPAPGTVEYRLPFPAGTSALVTQGNAGPYTHEHRSFSEFAWDFVLPEGSMISAAAEGTVALVEDGNEGGGAEDIHRSRANYIVIGHADGRYSVYLHLAYRGSLVEPGQHVQTGQGIGLSGSTGYATGPHLHFQVQKAMGVSRSWSVPVSFADAGVPAYGESPVSGNVFLPPAPAPRATDAAFTFPQAAAGLPPTLFTHQGLTMAIAWADSETVPNAGAPGRGGPTDVRIMMADGDGLHSEVASGVTSGRAGLQGRAAVPVPGPVTLWAEYRDGVAWRVLGTASGDLVSLTTAAVANDVFVTAPGLVVSSTGDFRGARVYDVAFTVVNLGSEPRRLRGLTVGASLSLPSPPAGTGAGPWPFTGAPAIKDVYLAPGGSRAWHGTLTLSEPGRYTLSPVADDSAGDPLFFPAAEVGQPATATIVLEDTEPPPPRQTFADVPPDHPCAAAIDELAARGLLTGYPGPAGARLFRPDDPVTRAQFAKLVVEALGLPVDETDVCHFVDVEVSGAAGLFPDNFVAVAAAAGITRGTTLDPPRFSPYAPVTRGQAVTMVLRAAPDSQAALPGDPTVPATRAEAARLAAALLD